LTYAPTSISPKLSAYYRGKKWRTRRALYWANHERMCLACMYRGKGVQLNHVRYPKVWWRWGNEPDRWFYPLCGRCHDAVTQECRAKRRPGVKVDIRQVTVAYIHRTRTARKLPRFRESVWTQLYYLFF
jgi:hypothetical protein